MAESSQGSIEKELLQPRPRRVQADVPDFVSGRQKLTFGVLYVLAWLMLPALVFWLFIKPAAGTSDTDQENRRAAKARERELQSLKQNGITVDGTASVRSADERYDKESNAYYIEVKTDYTYPGGHGAYTDMRVSPHTSMVMGDADSETAKELDQIRFQRPWKIKVVYLPDDPSVHCLADDLDKDLTKYQEQVDTQDQQGASNERALLWGLFCVTSPGWLIGLLGLLQMAATFRQRFFLSQDARQQRNLACDGVAVLAVVTEVTVKRQSWNSLSEDQEIHYRFEAGDGIARKGRFAHYVGLESDRRPVGSHVTVLYDTRDPNHFVRYKELRGVRLVPPEPGRDVGLPPVASSTAAPPTASGASQEGNR